MTNKIKKHILAMTLISVSAICISPTTIHENELENEMSAFSCYESKEIKHLKDLILEQELEKETEITVIEKQQKQVKVPVKENTKYETYFNPDVGYMKEPLSRDIPLMDNRLLFILARKLILESK